MAARAGVPTPQFENEYSYWGDINNGLINNRGGIPPLPDLLVQVSPNLPPLPYHTHLPTITTNTISNFQDQVRT